MTDAEFDAVREEIRARKARTSFPAPADPDEYETHGHHAEYGGSEH